MERNYWSDIFTGKSWEEFQKNGASVSGFPERKTNNVKRIRPGDYLICYVAGLGRFIGVLEVLSDSYHDVTPIWSDGLYPVRLKVKIVHALNPKTAVPSPPEGQTLDIQEPKDTSILVGIL